MNNVRDSYLQPIADNLKDKWDFLDYNNLRSIMNRIDGKDYSI